MAFREDVLDFLEWLTLRDEQYPFGSGGIPEAGALFYLNPDAQKKNFGKLIDLYLKERPEQLPMRRTDPDFSPPQCWWRPLV